MTKIASVAIFICLILLLAFWIRVQGTESIPAGQFTETDAYFYYWQAQLISEHGQLPALDMHRWLPVGRDLRQTLNLYGYVLAYTHKFVSAVFPNVTLYHVCLYMPVACFCLGLGALCLFLYQSYGLMFSITVGVILATLPGSIERSTAGFGDRDAFCLMIGILAITTYLASLQAQHRRDRLLWTLISGFTVFLGGISWEGFGVFLSVILVVELWRFLSTEKEEGLGLYLLWVLTFVPTLYWASPAYRSGYGFAKHLAAFVLLPAVVLLAIRTIRYLLMSKVNVLRKHARALSLGLTLAGVVLALGYVFIQQNTFADTTVPLSQTPVMQAMTELKAPHYKYWVARYGTVFLVGSLGFVLIPLCLWKKQGILLSIPLIFFALSTFFRQPLDNVWGVSPGNVFFGISGAACAIALIAVAWKRDTQNRNVLVLIAFTVWFLLWVGLSRDAKRYDFFIGVSLAYGTAALIQLIAQTCNEKLCRSVYVIDRVQQDFKSSVLKTGVSAILLTFLMWLPINYAHTYRAVYAAKEMRDVTPTPIVAKAFFWMKSALPNTAVVVANWSYGSQLNVLGGVKTVTDQDTYIQHWIHLYYKHVIYAKTEREALEFLKTHGATHLMLVGREPAKHFLEGKLSDAFVSVYPKENFVEENVNVWELHYPTEIQMDDKYLETGFPELDAQLETR